MEESGKFSTKKAGKPRLFLLKILLVSITFEQ
jgi:hypothetical protein